MHIAKGRTRFVIAFPRLGFVIKFPFIQIWVFKDTIQTLLKKEWGLVWEKWFVRVENPYGHPNKVLIGIWSNLLECYFWYKTRHPVLFPTWFSFLGLFNIQKYGKPLGNDEAGYVAFVIDRLSNQETQFCEHGFEDPSNYTSVDGRLRIIDYGSRRLWPIMTEYGHKIMQATVTECKTQETARKG